MYYTVIKHDGHLRARGKCNKTWGFDQSERAQGPIYVIMENTPLVKFLRNYLRDSSGIFSISSLVSISMISLISSLSLNQVRVEIYKISTNMFLTVKILKKCHER